PWSRRKPRPLTCRSRSANTSPTFGLSQSGSAYGRSSKACSWTSRRRTTACSLSTSFAPTALLEGDAVSFENAETVGVVGSPSTTGEVTLDVVGDAAHRSLVGSMVLLEQQMDGRTECAL